MKVMDLQCITHCTNEDYQLITIHGVDDTLIHVKPSKTLQKRLLKQKDKAKSIKTRVNWIQQASLLLNGIQHWTSNLINEWNMKHDKMNDDAWWWQERWHGKERRHAGEMTDEEWQKTCRETWHILRRQHIRYNYYK